MPNSLSRQRTTAVSVLILLVVTLLVAPLLTRSLQADEASSIWFTQLPWRSFLADFCDPHPPGYYLLLKGWLTLGNQAIWSRLLSLWAVQLAIALTLRLGRDLVNARTGILAAALLAFQPLTLWYAAQTRMYALVMLLGILAFWVAWRLWHTNGRSYFLWLGYWLTASALFWADFTGLFVWGLLQLIWLAFGRPHFRRWLLVQTAVLLPYLFLMRLLPASQTLSHSYQPIFVAVQAMKFGLHLPPDQAAILLLMLLSIVAVVGILIAAIGPRFYRRWPAQSRTLLMFILISAWLFLIFAAAIPRLYTIKRLLVPMLPLLALATAALTKSWSPRRAFALVLPGLLVCLLILPRHPGEAWQTAVTEITKNAPQGARFWVDDMIVPAFAYYIDPEFADQWHVLNGRFLPQLPPVTPAANAPLFIVSTNTPYRALLPLLPLSFHQNYKLTQEHNWPGSRIYEFQPHSAIDPSNIDMPQPSPAAQWGLLLPSPLDTCQFPLPLGEG